MNELVLFRTGAVDIARSAFQPWTLGAARDERVVAPVWSALLRTNEGNVVFDTGLHPVHVERPDATFGPQSGLKVMMENEDAIVARLAALDMCVSLQVERDQLVALAPMLERSGVRVLVDHCGRPSPAAGVGQAGFRELLRLAGTDRVYVKLSGYLKWAGGPYPYDVARPYVDALLDAFTPRRCLWASDWPFLRAATRIDIGPLLVLFERLVPRSEDRRHIQWETPRRLLGFAP